MENGETVLNLLPGDAHTHLCNAANKLDRRELARTAYFYVQTLDETNEIVELLLRTENRLLGAETVQTADSHSSSRVLKLHRG